MVNKNAIFVLAGNCRTFLDCIDSLYLNIISKLFDENTNIYLYLYLKLIDPGPKMLDGSNFTYETINHDKIVDKLNNIKMIYPHLNIDYKLLENNEISDDELFSQVKNRHLFTSPHTFSYNLDHVLLRGLHCHYNFEKCGNYLLEKEKNINSKFDYIIYVRPDLFFTHECNNINYYNNDLITLGNNFYAYNSFDLFAIIPRKYLDIFFFGRMEIYRNNNDTYFSIPEDVFIHNIPYEIKDIGRYYIKR